MNIDTNIEKESESCKLTAYPDPKWHGIARTAANHDAWGKPWTNGWGHIKGVYEGQVITQDQADQWLIDDLHDALMFVGHAVTVPLNDNQMSALVDFVFNVGGKNFAGSTLLKLLNEGKYDEAAAQFGRWNHAGALTLVGLTKRRAAEAAMFKAGTV